MWFLSLEYSVVNVTRFLAIARDISVEYLHVNYFIQQMSQGILVSLPASFSILDLRLSFQSYQWLFRAQQCGFFCCVQRSAQLISIHCDNGKRFFSIFLNLVPSLMFFMACLRCLSETRAVIFSGSSLWQLALLSAVVANLPTTVVKSM